MRILKIQCLNEKAEEKIKQKRLLNKYVCTHKHEYYTHMCVLT